MISKTKVKNLGKEIRLNNGSINTEQLSTLQDYRISFIPALTRTFHSLNKISNKFDSQSIVAFRLKRIETIVNKLIRLQNTQLTTMGDIAGLRCIFNTEEQLLKAFELIKQKFNIEGKIRNYVQTPKPIGYKGIHCYIMDSRYNKKVEIQLRTKEHHNWATLVEITDLLYDLRLKELGFESDIKFAKFHSLMSSKKVLSHEEAEFIYSHLRDVNFISNLSTTFMSNYNEVKKSWWRKGKTDSFFLIEARKDRIPKLNSFKSFKKAEAEYFQRYKNKENAEIVLASIKNPTFSQLSIAYANYILAYHTFIRDIKPILMEMASEAVEMKKFTKFKRIFKTYEELQANILIDIIMDNEDLILESIKKGKINFHLKKGLKSSDREHIKNNIDSKLNHAATKHKEYISELYSLIPKSYLVNFRYTLFLKRHNKRLKEQLSKKDIVFERFE